MWLVSIAPWLTLAAMAPETRVTPSTAAEAMPRPIATRQALFAIPFQISRPEQASREPVEVQLFVSDDLGKTWRHCSAVEPARRQFVFRAAHDGEYWFRIRTRDRSGQLRPRQPGPPGLRVIVDTVPPSLDLKARRGRAGQITALWKISETNPNLESLAILYRTTPDGPWQSVALAREKMHRSGSTQTGEVTWWSPASDGKMQIRAEVADAAGNPAVSHAQVDLSQGTGPQPPQAASNQPPGPWQAATPDRLPGSLHPANRPPETGIPASPSAGTNAEAPGGGHATSHLLAGSVAATTNPPIRNQYVTPCKGDTLFAGSGLPPGRTPQMINSRRFELAYDAESVGPSGISRVELWGTRDGGQTWKSFALDDDNRSPLLATVDEEGIYGFRVVVQSGAGLGGIPPKSGELPDVWIGVDLTKPIGRITATEAGTGRESGKLIIFWQAHDETPAARPISLLYGTGPAGPWTTIAAGLQNTGRYAWSIDHRVPREIYLRLEVRDEAGNVGVFETAKAVSLDQRRPSVYIRDVRPLGQSAHRPPRKYYLR